MPLLHLILLEVDYEASLPPSVLQELRPQQEAALRGLLPLLPALQNQAVLRATWSVWRHAAQTSHAAHAQQASHAAAYSHSRPSSFTAHERQVKSAANSFTAPPRHPSASGSLPPPSRHPSVAGSHPAPSAQASVASSLSGWGPPGSESQYTPTPDLPHIHSNPGTGSLTPPPHASSTGSAPGTSSTTQGETAQGENAYDKTATASSGWVPHGTTGPAPFPAPVLNHAHAPSPLLVMGYPFSAGGVLSQTFPLPAGLHAVSAGGVLGHTLPPYTAPQAAPEAVPHAVPHAAPHAAPQAAPSAATAGGFQPQPAPQDASCPPRGHSAPGRASQAPPGTALAALIPAARTFAAPTLAAATSAALACADPPSYASYTAPNSAAPSLAGPSSHELPTQASQCPMASQATLRTAPTADHLLPSPHDSLAGEKLASFGVFFSEKDYQSLAAGNLGLFWSQFLCVKDTIILDHFSKQFFFIARGGNPLISWIPQMLRREAPRI